MTQLSDEIIKYRDKKYNDWARKRPAYISLALPSIYCLLYFNIYGEQLTDIKYIITILVGLTSIIGSIFFLYMFLIRDVSKIFPGLLLFARWFKPTNKLLFDGNNTFSDHTKNEIRIKINDVYHINLLKIENKSCKNKEYIKLIEDAVLRMKNDTRFDDILFEYNCIYGFYRNLSAGIFLNILLLIVAAIISCKTDIYYSVSFLPASVILLIFETVIIYFCYNSGLTYAKQLYTVFRGLRE